MHRVSLGACDNSLDTVNSTHNLSVLLSTVESYGISFNRRNTITSTLPPKHNCDC